MPYTERMANVPRAACPEIISDFESEGATVTSNCDAGGVTCTITAVFPDVAALAVNEPAEISERRDDGNLGLAMAIMPETPLGDEPYLNQFARSIKSAAETVGCSARALAAIAWIESGFRNIRNGTGSSATGPFQFIPTTWAAMVARYGDQHGISTDMITKPSQQSYMAAHLLVENTESLKRLGVLEPSTLDLYLAHFFGAGAAGTVIEAEDNQKIDKVLLAHYGDTERGRKRVALIIKQNRGIMTKPGGALRNVSKVKAIFRRKLDSALDEADRLLARGTH